MLIKNPPYPAKMDKSKLARAPFLRHHLLERHLGKRKKSILKVDQKNPMNLIKIKMRRKKKTPK